MSLNFVGRAVVAIAVMGIQLALSTDSADAQLLRRRRCCPQPCVTRCVMPCYTASTCCPTNCAAPCEAMPVSDCGCASCGPMVGCDSCATCCTSRRAWFPRVSYRRGCNRCHTCYASNCGTCANNCCGAACCGNGCCNNGCMGSCMGCSNCATGTVQGTACGCPSGGCGCGGEGSAVSYENATATDAKPSEL